jgi:hypothetical protein
MIEPTQQHTCVSHITREKPVKYKPNIDDCVAKKDWQLDQNM